MTVAARLAGAAQRDVVQHRDVILHHRRLADDDAMPMVEHDAAPDARSGVNVDGEYRGGAALDVEGEVATA